MVIVGVGVVDGDRVALGEETVHGVAEDGPVDEDDVFVRVFGQESSYEPVAVGVPVLVLCTEGHVVLVVGHGQVCEGVP